MISTSPPRLGGEAGSLGRSIRYIYMVIFMSLLTSLGGCSRQPLVRVCNATPLNDDFYVAHVAQCWSWGSGGGRFERLDRIAALRFVDLPVTLPDNTSASRLLSCWTE